MKLNLVVGTKDLGRTRFAVSPLQNLILGVWGHRPSRARQRWWGSVRRHAPASAAPLLELVNAHPWYVPDFLTPTAPGTQTPCRSLVSQELEALSCVTDAQIRADLRGFGDRRGVPRIVRQLRDGGTREMASVIDAARALFQACLADDWRDIQHRLRTDIAHRAGQMATVGAGPMLNGLHPRLSWSDDTTLAVALGDCGRRTGPDETTIDLSGNGLLLMPSPFVNADMIAITGSVTARHTAVIAYPARSPAAADSGPDGLTVLIGQGKARALRALQGAATTTELARRLGVSMSTASQHTTALRAAGLLITHRNGRSVQHSLTDLGTHLLANNPPRQNCG